MKVYIVIATYDGCCSQDSICSVRTTEEQAKKDIDFFKNKDKGLEYDIEEYDTEEELKN